MVKHIYLLHNGIEINKLDILREFVCTYESKLIDISTSHEAFAFLKIDKHASIANYFRLLVPVLLPATVDKVLYLDSDMIVRKSINRIWNTDLEGYLLAAVENVGFSDYERLEMPYGSKYFNSGLMLINLSKWRQENTHLKVIDYIQHNPDRIELWDQDGLNAILFDSWLELPLRWNVQHSLFFNTFYRARYFDVVEDPGIIHFSGMNLKPWQYNVQHPYRYLYDKYREKTPWPSYTADGKPNVLSRLRSKLKFEVKRQISALAREDQFWKFADKILVIPDFLLRERNSELQHRFLEEEQYQLEKQIQMLFPDLTVGGGPFTGLRYPKIKSVGSTIAPKLLGTYESELHNTIEAICEMKYSTVIDIGCAEGYYAVGLAMRINGADVFAIDMDPVARQLCKDMAKLNGVENRVKIKEYFTMRSLREINCSGKGIIICDCEGCEKAIFYEDPEVWLKLTNNFDILIEVHDFILPGVSEYLIDLFSECYEIESILSVGDILRPRRFHSKIIGNLDYKDRIKLMAENRPSAMEWLFMKSKYV